MPKTNRHVSSVVNVASVPQRSPFRYPGGKTWLVPYVRAWFRSLGRRPALLLEPFAGGGIIGLTAAAEGLAGKVIMGELDEGVASVWETILGDQHEWLIERILGFPMSRANVIAVLAQTPGNARERAFQTLLRNRVNRGGILAPGASLVKLGENGRGVASRWYPRTLAARISTIASMRDRIAFVRGDALHLIRRHHQKASAAFFVDPPYTAGGKGAGRRLYAHSEVDHRGLFAAMARAAGPVMLTYDDAPEVRGLAAECGFRVEEVPMKNTHHEVMRELVITNAGSCLPRPSLREAQPALLAVS
jgi:DNA adenine methylase